MEPSVLHLFGRQLGVASVAQIQDLGASSHTISRWRRAGRVVDVLPGVVRLAGAPDTFRSRCMALCVRTGADGMLGDISCGRVWEVPHLPRSRVQIMVPRRTAITAPDWAQVVHTRWSESERVVRSDGLVVPCPERTLFILGSRLGEKRFQYAAENLWYRRLINPPDLADWLRRNRGRGRTGVKRMERWIDSVGDRSLAMQTRLEIDLIEACVDVGLPRPIAQYKLVVDQGRVVIYLDGAWPEVKLGIEPGHTKFHLGDRARADSQRDKWCDEIGWRTPRFDETELRDIEGCALQIKQIYRERQTLFRSSGP